MKTPQCEHAQLFLDGRLGAPERAAFETHWPTCTECKPFIETWQSFAQRVVESNAPLLAPPTAVQQQRFAAKVRTRVAEPSSRFAWRWAFAAATAAAVAGGVVWSWRPSPLAQEAVPVFAVEDGKPGGAVADEVDAPVDQPIVVAIGEDRVGVAAKARVHIERHDREKVKLRLDSGSVAAHVKHREQGQSFVIEAGRYEVTVVGTRFRVERLDDGLHVDVIEGHVKVTSGNQTFDVLRGQSLELDSRGARTGTFDGAEFSELNGGTPGPSPLAAVDSGSPEEADDAAQEPSEPSRSPQGVSAAVLQQWRRGALDGKCGQLLPVLRVKAQEHPRQAEVWVVLADCQRKTGNDRDAATAYRHVVSVAGVEDADHARVLLASLLLERLGDAAGAAEVLRAYLKHRQVPALEAGARVELAKAYVALGKKAQARAELEHVVKVMPDSPPALEALDLLKHLQP